MEFIFRPGKIGKGFTEEVALILAKRTEIASRQKMPALWDKIDRMNENKAPEEVLNKRKKRHVFYGIILIAVGFFLFVPGLMKPKELFVPLIAGAFSMINGIFAVLPGRNRTESFEKSAKKLIKSIDASLKDGESLVFDDLNIAENGNAVMKYEEIENAFETKNFFFISDGTKALLLRKCDLVLGNGEELKAFLEEKTGGKIIFCI